MRSIGEVAAWLGVTASALRFWDERGLVSPARKSGARYYDEDDLHRLAMVKMLRGTGMLSLDEIDVLLRRPQHGDWRTTVQTRLSEIRAQQEKLAAAEEFLGHFLACPREDPVKDCPELRAHTARELKGTFDK
ncbi:MerR family transcriptional regulator [Amycolatopsis sp. NPDC059021]|uniref:MerR family transcriptional regulator n=1 Tax=Amycolatopsis sp. NPDC059021 TaxID=3346704 RepID=UPI00366D0122